MDGTVHVRFVAPQFFILISYFSARMNECGAQGYRNGIRECGSQGRHLQAHRAIAWPTYAFRRGLTAYNKSLSAHRGALAAGDAPRGRLRSSRDSHGLAFVAAVQFDLFQALPHAMLRIRGS